MITYRLVQSKFRVRTFIINGGVLNRNAELGVYCYDDTGFTFIVRIVSRGSSSSMRVVLTS